MVLWLEALAFSEAFFRLCPLASGFPLAPGPRRTRQTGSSGEPHALRPRARGVAVSLHLPCPVPLYILRDLGVLRRRDGDSTSSSVQSSGRPPVVREAERLATAGPEHEGARQPLLPQTEGPHPGPGPLAQRTGTTGSPPRGDGEQKRVSDELLTEFRVKPRTSAVGLGQKVMTVRWRGSKNLRGEEGNSVRKGRLEVR